ncbi:MAG: hypothetical protein K8U57_25975 [Planctomycetes bacterium]|nr:hypothetical protein [Planctomycetota bacterium]
MRLRFAYTLAAMFALVGVASAQPPSPAIVVQAKPVSRLLTDFKEMLRQIGGPAQGDTMVKEFERELKDTLGEHGFEGLDINRPIVAYSELKNKPEECGLVLAVPVTTEKEFLAFLGRIKIKAVAVEGKKGLYELDLPDDEFFLQTSHLRFVEGGLAYLTLNDGEPTDVKKLIPITDLVDQAEQSLVAVKLYPGRVPAKLVANMLDELDQVAGQLKMFLGAGQGADGKVLKALLEQGPKLVRRYTETALKEVNEIDVKFNFDPATGDTLTELVVMPKPGTPLAKEIAATKATTNRFAGLVTKDAAGGILLKAPLFAKEVQEIVAALLEGGQQEFKQGDLPQSFAPVVDEIAKGLIRSVKKDELDAGVALLGPDKDGKFTVVAGMSFDNTTELEKAVREAAKPADLAKHFEFDAAKVGEVNIHKVPLTRLLKEEALTELSKVFGEKPVSYVAFAKDAVFVGFGPGALDAVKAALETKSAPAPVLDVSGNMDRFHKLMTAIDPKAAKMFAKHMGTADMTVNVLRVTIDSGTKLTAKVSLNVRVLPRMSFVAEGATGGTTTFEKVGDKVK